MRERVAADEFIGYELHAARRLRMFRRNDDESDLRADIRLWALEAADNYDPSKGVWGTFLFRHLQLCCLVSYRNLNRQRRAVPSALISLEEAPPPAHRDDPAFRVELQDLLAGVSDEARSFLQTALRQNSKQLQRALKSSYYKACVERVLGTPREKVKAAVDELRREIPRYIEGIDARR